MIVCAAALLQLHLFFAAELHHHTGNELLGSSRSQVSTVSASARPDQICAACRISQRGAIQLAVASSIPVEAGTAEVLLPSSPLRVSSAALLAFSGRAPPVS